MPADISDSPPHHQPVHSDYRPKGILKNPSFSGPSRPDTASVTDPTNSDRTISPSHTADITNLQPATPLDPQAEKDLVLQNTLQNAGHRRSSSAARRASASSRRQSAAAGHLGHGNDEDDPDKQRLKWDEANLYLAEQDAGTRMKITEPKTPFEYGRDAVDEDDEEDVAIDPRYVNVDEVDMAKAKSAKKSRESEIPGLDIGEPEEDVAGTEMGGTGKERIVRSTSLSREGSKEKHVSVSDGESGGETGVGMPTKEEQAKHDLFEAQRRRHYEMRDVKGLLGHPEEADEDEDDSRPTAMPALPSRGVNGTQ